MNNTVLKNSLFIAVLGIISSLGFAPYNYVFVVPLTFGGMLFFNNKQKLKQSFFYGWLFGTCHFAFGTYWIANALMKDQNIPTILIPLAVLGLSTLLGVYPALTFLLSNSFKNNISKSSTFTDKNNISKSFSFAAFWTLFEFIRSWLLTGFPWNPLGSIWITNDKTIQLASQIGVYGLSLITAFFIALSLLLYQKINQKYKKKSTITECCKFLLSTLIPFSLLYSCLYIYGFYKLSNNPTEFFENKQIRLVQPNIKQEMKWNRQTIEDNFIKHLEMNFKPSKTHISAFIWGETASPYFLETDEFNKKRAVQTLTNDSLLITGVLRKENFNYYNSLVVIDKNEKVIANYDKSHLVPFGEYIPFRNILPIKKITEGFVDLSKGSGAKIIHTNILPPFTPIICYEIIFSGHIKPKNKSPDWFLNITNDGWYGDSSGPYQHLAATRIRAVEEGIPIIRVANTGVSAVIDGNGRILDYIGLNKEGIIDHKLPKALTKKGLFNKFSNLIPISLLILFLLIGLYTKKEQFN